MQVMVTYLRIRGWKPGPLFCTWEGKALSRTKFVAEVQKAIISRGKSAKGYTGHSFRCGAATTAATLGGVGEATIKMLGRWSSAAYQVESILLSSRQCYRGSLQSAKR